MVERGRAREVLGRTVNDEAYLSVKELLYARQELLPINTKFRLISTGSIETSKMTGGT